MSGEPTNNVNGAPAPSQAPAPAITYADPTAHVRLPNGTAVPISELLRDGQTYEAGQALMQRAREIEQRSRADSEEASAMRQFRAQLELTPQAIIDGLQQRYLHASHQNTAGDDLGGDGRSTQPRANGSAGSESIAELHTRLARIEARSSQADLESEVDAVLARFPALQGNEKAMRLARNLVFAGKVTNPDLTLDQIARRVNSDVIAAIEHKPTGDPTSVRDERLARGALMPNLSPNIGNPELAKIPAPVGDRGINSKHWIGDTAQWIDAMLGQTPPTT